MKDEKSLRNRHVIAESLKYSLNYLRKEDEIRMNKIELLSPAGSFEKLETAFIYGADAAYMGLKSFSLRANAKNFSQDEAENIRALKEKYRKKFYCTVNIFFSNKEIADLRGKVEEIKAYPFDAFIISDIGILDIMKNAFPNAEMHLSTQANCINAESAAMYRKMGFDRVILGRETPLDEIKEIKDRNPELGIEVFAHGAMCMSYSGRCLLSAHLAGRSANKGDCAHTCRWKYKLSEIGENRCVDEDEKFFLEEETRPGVYFPIIEEDNYTTIMSSKDLCMIDHLADLRNAGVDSLKIEGRMKSIYYVATVTRAYRKALDYLYDNTTDYLPFRNELFNVSHREYSTGFFYSNAPIEDDDINKPAQDGYLRDYAFLGVLKEEVRPGVWSLDIKNQIANGCKIEFIGPDVLFIEDENFEVLDENFEKTAHIDHCNNGYIYTEKPVKSGYIIRKEIK